MSIKIVEKYRGIYANLQGAERAWNITNHVALELGDGWGLIRKASGMNYQGFSIDCIVNKNTKKFVDLLVSSEELCLPSWQERAASDSELEQWSPAIGNVPEPEPEPGEDITITKVYELCQKIYAKLDSHLK